MIVIDGGSGTYGWAGLSAGAFVQRLLQARHGPHGSRLTGRDAAHGPRVPLEGAQAVASPQVPQLEATVECPGQRAVSGPIRVESPHKADVAPKPGDAGVAAQVPQREAAVVGAAEGSAVGRRPPRADCADCTVVCQEHLGFGGGRLGLGAVVLRTEVPVGEVAVFEAAHRALPDDVDGDSGHGGACGDCRGRADVDVADVRPRHQIPHAHEPVPETCARLHLRPMHGKRVDRGTPSKGQPAPVLVEVPQLDRAVHGAAQSPHSGPVDFERAHLLRVPFPRPQALARFDIPELQAPVEAADEGAHALPVNGDCQHSRRSAGAKVAGHLAVLEVPELEASVARS
mmetsp:Transcript_1981/g.5245  ORF Transcript_1981/g.5245 Transcript_1981/m.5245 type:complete len:343 (-) Transcript_1981:884-1912(-)